mmetsp:Transcript_7479/g.21294  ORF Transcript_7479/g.21294 Transcript_7479/m.21294 type:complete len:358 (+) Transcript_7479:1206-2279(+)
MCARRRMRMRCRAGPRRGHSSCTPSWHHPAHGPRRQRAMRRRTVHDGGVGACNFSRHERPRHERPRRHDARRCDDLRRRLRRRPCCRGQPDSAGRSGHGQPAAGGDAYGERSSDVCHGLPKRALRLRSHPGCYDGHRAGPRAPAAQHFGIRWRMLRDALRRRCAATDCALVRPRSVFHARGRLRGPARGLHAERLRLPAGNERLWAGRCPFVRLRDCAGRPRLLGSVGGRAARASRTGGDVRGPGDDAVDDAVDHAGHDAGFHARLCGRLRQHAGHGRARECPGHVWHDDERLDRERAGRDRALDSVRHHGAAGRSSVSLALAAPAAAATTGDARATRAPRGASGAAFFRAAAPEPH